MLNTIEKSYFFRGGQDRSLLGFLHLPTNPVHDTGILYLHPFAEEKNCSHGVVTRTARLIAQLGYPVLRFDLSGCGDSEGELEQVTISDWLEDIAQAIRELKSAAGVQKIALWGLRLGAGLALVQLNRLVDCPFVILWQPVFQFKDYIHQFLRQKLSTTIAAGAGAGTSVNALISQMQNGLPVTVMGYVINIALYDSFVATDAGFVAKANCPRIWLASVDLLETPAYGISRFAGQLGADSTHIVEEPFWDRYWRWQAPSLTQATLDWLGRRN